MSDTVRLARILFVLVDRLGVVRMAIRMRPFPKMETSMMIHKIADFKIRGNVMPLDWLKLVSTPELLLFVDSEELLDVFAGKNSTLAEFISDSMFIERTWKEL